jgi:polyisoprenoid-binding protein YceI
MRALIIALSLGLGACASIPGAANAPAPFTGEAEASAAGETRTAPANLPAGAYRLDPRHATVLFRIRHMGLAWFTARFDGKDARLELDPADPTRSRLAASVEANSVNTGVPGQQGDRAFDRAIGRALGAERSPQITFSSTSIERTGQFTARINGDLSMNGQTHPAVFEATFDGGAVDPLRGGAMALGFSAHATIDRSQWGVTEWRSVIGDEVQIVVEAELVKS